MTSTTTLLTNEKLITDIESLLATAKSYDVSQPQRDRLIRLDLLSKIEALRYELDDPDEAMFRQLTNYSETAAVRSLMQMDAIAAIPREGSIDAKTLARNIGADEEVLVRLMRIITATGILKSGGENTYMHTRFSLAYLEGSEVDFYDLCVEEISPVANLLPSYISSHSPNSILDPKKSPYSWFAKKEGKSFYEVLLDFPERLARFNKAMMTQEAALPVLGMFHFGDLVKQVRSEGGEEEEEKEKEKEKENEERVFLVDVAGGRGQSLMQIKGEIEMALDDEKDVGKVKGKGRKIGKMILQDRKQVLDAVSEDRLPGIEKMVIDFFQPQPVKKAHIYYLRRIMHNWQDNEARLILQNIASAMAPDSRLLIGEMVVPPEPEGNGVGDKTVYWMDLCMLIIGGKERSEREFSKLLDEAGLVLVRIWRSKVGPQTVIECQLK